MSDIVERLRETIVAYDEWYQGQLKTSDTLLERFSRERHEAADEILRLRAENETLRRDVKTAVMGDSAELQDVKRDNEKLRKALLYVYDNSLGLDPDKITDDIEWVTAEIRAAAAAIRESGE